VSVKSKQPHFEDEDENDDEDDFARDIAVLQS
jgi:hypothetical protein